MTQQVVTELVIDASGAQRGAAQFNAAMDSAASAASKTVGTVQNAAASIVIGFGGIVAAAAGLRAFVDYVGNVNAKFASIGESARNAGLSIKEFQQTLYAAKVAGLSDKDFVSGLDRIGADLLQASRGATEFGKLFEANGLKIRNVNGDLISTKEALAGIANLVKNAPTPQVEQALVKIVGLSRDWIPFLRQGAETIETIKARAVSVGAVVDDDIIAKAKDFDREWKAAVAAWDQQFKASLSSILPLLIKLANIASVVLDKAGEVGGFFSRKLTPVDDMGVKDLETQLADLTTLRNLMKDIGPEIDEFTQFRMGVKRGGLGLDPDAGLADVDKEIGRVQELIKRRKELSGLPRVTVFGDGSTNLPAIEAEKNAFDRAADSIIKHTARMEADAKAVGLGVGAQEEFRAQSALTTAAMQAGIPITQALADKIQDLAQDAGDAATALAFDKAWDRANFDKMTMGLSDLDKQIASTMKNIYGPEWQAHMDDALAKQLRMNDAMRQMQDATKGFTSDFLSGLREGKSAMDALLGAASNFATKLANMGLDKMMSGLTDGGDFSKLFSGIGQSASQGIVEGFEAIQAKAAAAKANPANAFSFNGTGNAGMAGLAAVGAGLGIYAQGQQVGMAGGSATSAALSGAITGGLSGGMLAGMTGGAVAGPVGIAIGAVVGGIAGLLGASDGAKKAAQQAKDDWANAKTAADLFGKQLAGDGQGSLTTALAQAKSQVEQYTIMAQKAKDQDASDRLGDQYNQYYKRMTESFRDSFNGIVDAFSSGLGPNSPFATGAKNVKDIGEELKGFIEDTKTAMEYLAPGASGPAVAQATAAAQKYMLSLLGQAPVLTDTQTAIQHLNGTAAQLQTTLVELGVSSQDAAVAIQSGVLASMKQLANTFANGLQREINAASGHDYLNSMADLVAKFQSNLADAASLGLGPDLVNKWFKVSAQKIVDDAGLAGDAIATLAKQFPDLAGVVTSSLQGLQAAYDDATSLVNGRRQDLVTAYQTEAKALQDNVEKTRSWIAQLKQFQQSLNIGQYSPYSPEQQYLNAKNQAQQDFALAMGGDQDAMDRIQNDLSTYLDQSRSYNASSEQYFRDFQDAQDMLDKLQAGGQKQLSTSQQQLDALNAQVSGLIDIKDTIGVTNTSVLSVTAAIAALQSALAGQKQASDALVTANPQSNIDALYQSVLGRSADAAGKAYWQQQIAAGLSGTDLTRSFISGAYAKGGADAAAAAAYAKLHGYQNGGLVGMYANGGIVGNGLLGIDSVMARYAGGGYIGLAGGEYVMPTSQTRANLPQLEAMRSGRSASNDNGWRDVVAEVKSLRQDNQRLTAVVERLTAVVAASDQETRAVLKEG